jgi:hypothetical protein
MVHSVKGKDLEAHQPGKIGVDLDGTLAKWMPGGKFDPKKIGAPIPKMVDRVKRWLANGEDVHIFTARVDEDKDGVARRAIEEWCQKYLGQVLPITNKKDRHFKTIYDDRAVQVERNDGSIIASHRKASAQ